MKELYKRLIRKEIIFLVLPIMVEQAFTILLGIVNTMMAGHLGDSTVAAIGMVDSINSMFVAFFAALSVGATVVVAQQIGQKKINDANETVKQALVSGLIISVIISTVLFILRNNLITTFYSEATAAVIRNARIYLEFTLISYPFIAIEQICNGILRGSGDTKTPMTITIRMNIINVILGYLLIYGINFTGFHISIHTPSFGIEGTAIAIAVARLFGALLALRILFKANKTIHIDKMFPFSFKMNTQKKIFSIGIPAGVEQLLFSTGKFIITIFIVSMGTNAITSNTIGFSCGNLLNVVGNSFSLGATIIVGQFIGKKEIERAKNNLLYMNRFATVVLVTLGLILIPVAPHIVSFYTKSPEIIKLTSTLIMAYGLAMIAWPSSFILSAGLKGAGDTRYTMVTAIIGMWAFRIAVGGFLGVVLGFGVLGVWFGMFADWFVRAIMYHRRLHGEKWTKHAVI